MFKCEYCSRELKSNAGLSRHMAACKKKVMITPEKVVILEVVGTEETYYAGHPRRLTKLKGLLSKTFDKNERIKIIQMILDEDK